MKYRFKRRLFLIVFAVMLVGIAGFSMTGKNIKLPYVRLDLKKSSRSEDLSKITTFGAVSTIKGVTDAELQKDIENLVRNYYDAKQRVDMNALSLYVSHSSRIDRNELEAESKYVEKYDNIKCFCLNTNTRGAYRVYVRCDTRIYNVNEPVPSLDALYLKPDLKGHLRVYLGALKADESNDIKKLDSLRIVKNLQSDVQKSMERTIEDNKDAAQFYENIVGETEQNNTTSENKGMSAENKSSEDGEKEGENNLKKNEKKNEKKDEKKSEDENNDSVNKNAEIKLKKTKKKLKKARKKKKRIQKKMKKYKKKKNSKKIRKYGLRKKNVKKKIKKLKARKKKLKARIKVKE